VIIHDDQSTKIWA